MSEKYFLMPGVTISKPGLPGKKLECKKGNKPLEIKKEHVEIIKKNLGFLLTQGKIVTANDLETKKESKPRKKKEVVEDEPINIDAGDGE